MYLRIGGDYVEFDLEYARHRRDLQGKSQEGINGGQCTKKKLLLFFQPKSPIILQAEMLSRSLCLPRR